MSRISGRSIRASFALRILPVRVHSVLRSRAFDSVAVIATSPVSPNVGAEYPALPTISVVSAVVVAACQHPD
jgi:hypothetical protein